jgi:hypothetical protein
MLKYLIVLLVDLAAACMLSPKIKGANRKETILRRSFDPEIKYIFSAACKPNEPLLLMITNKNKAIIVIITKIGFSNKIILPYPFFLCIG